MTSLNSVYINVGDIPCVHLLLWQDTSLNWKTLIDTISRTALNYNILIVAKHGDLNHITWNGYIHRLSYRLNQLNSVLLLITGAFNTTPTDYLEVITEFFPLDVAIKQFTHPLDYELTLGLQDFLRVNIIPFPCFLPLILDRATISTHTRLHTSTTEHHYSI